MIEDWPEVEEVRRTVVDRYITLGGVRFDADDLLETLCAVRDDRVVTEFSRVQTAFLKSVGVLTTEGSIRWASPATLGENGPLFIEKLTKALHEKETT